MTTPAESTSIFHPIILRPWEARSFVARRKSRLTRLVTHHNSETNGYGATITRRYWSRLLFDYAYPGGFSRIGQYLHVPNVHPEDYPDRGAITAEDAKGMGHNRVRPIWEVGDTIWGKEAAYITPPNWGDNDDDTNTTDGEGNRRIVSYEATMGGASRDAAADYKIPRVPSIHLPRWAARITLTARDVDAHHMQDVTRNQMIEEGVTNVLGSNGTAWRFDDAGNSWPGWREAYRAMCEATFGDGIWDRDPWVWSVDVGVDIKGQGKWAVIPIQEKSTSDFGKPLSL